MPYKIVVDFFFSLIGNNCGILDLEINSTMYRVKQAIIILSVHLEHLIIKPKPLKLSQFSTSAILKYIDINIIIYKYYITDNIPFF